MADVDEEALSNSMKALSIIFILLILFANIWLLVRLFRGVSLDQIFKSPRRFMIATLAFGDIFLALFPMVVFARMAFQDEDFEQKCSTIVSANTYRDYYFPFVYIIAVCCLCIEIIKRRQIGTLGGSPMIGSIVFSGLPWVLGLLLIVPIVLAGMNWDTCVYSSYTKARARAAYIMSVIVPGVLAVICLAVLKNSNIEELPDIHGSEQQQSSLPPGAGPQFHSSGFTSTYPPPGPSPSAPPQQFEPGIDNSKFEPPPAYDQAISPNQGHSMPPQPSGYYNYGQSYGAPNPQPAGTFPNASQSYPPMHGYPQPYHAQPASAPTPAPFVYQTNASPTSSSTTTNIALEKSILVHACIWYILFMFPYTFFMLIVFFGDERVDMDSATRIGLMQAFFWFRFLRALVLPVVWKTNTPAN